MRLLIFELRPSALRRDGLAVALRSRLESVEERVGIKTHLELACHERLPADTEDGLYRVALEALNNALKHANADHVDVRLALQNGMVLLEIVDDGIGFDPEQAKDSGGFGLRGIKERVVRLGGRFSVVSRLGGGTRVRVEVKR
jgi:signal transduction histidine kinase